MIADDDPVVQSMLSMSLGEGFDLVGVAADSEAATALAEATQPDAALVDVDMPKGGGSAAVRGILEVSPATAVVVLSGDESDSVVRGLIAAGAVRYCRKGIGAQELSEAVIESVKVRALERHDLQPS